MGDEFWLTLPRNFTILHFEVVRQTESRWLLKCIVGLIGGRIFNMAANSSPKTVPECTSTVILTRFLAQPQSGE